MPHALAVVALRGVVALDLTIATHVFGNDPALGYSVTVCAASSGAVPTNGGFAVTATAGLEAVDRADTVVVPGYPAGSTVDPRVLDALRRAAARGARVMSI